MTKITIFSPVFLGAGKTTLIKKLIADGLCQGEKLVLIENEFGEIGIDGGFLKEAGIQITEMNSGCICCSLVGDFGRALQKVHRTSMRRTASSLSPRAWASFQRCDCRAVQALHAEDAELDRLCHRGRCGQGEAVYEELRRVLQQPNRATPAPSSSAAPRTSAKKSWPPPWRCCAKRTPRRPLSPHRGTSSPARSFWTRWSAAAP